MTTLDKVIEVLSDISLIDEIRPEMTMDDLDIGYIDRVDVAARLAIWDEIRAHTTVNDIVKLIETK